MRKLLLLLLISFGLQAQITWNSPILTIDNTDYHLLESSRIEVLRNWKFSRLSNGGVILNGIIFNPVQGMATLIIPTSFAPDAHVIANTAVNMVPFAGFNVYYVAPRNDYGNSNAYTVWRRQYSSRYGDSYNDWEIFNWQARENTVKVIPYDFADLTVNLELNNIFLDETPWPISEDIIARTERDWISTLYPQGPVPGRRDLTWASRGGYTLPSRTYDVSWDEFNGSIVFRGVELNSPLRLSMSNNRNLFDAVSSAPYVRIPNDLHSWYQTITVSEPTTLNVQLEDRSNHALFLYNDVNNNRVEYSYRRSHTDDWSDWADTWNKNNKHFAYVSEGNGNEVRLRITEIVNGIFRNYIIYLDGIAPRKVYNYHSIYDIDGWFQFTQSINPLGNISTDNIDWIHFENGRITERRVRNGNGDLITLLNPWQDITVTNYKNNDLTFDFTNGIRNYYMRISVNEVPTQ